MAAVSISGPAFRVTKKVIQEIWKEVMETALRISERLGFTRKKVNLSYELKGMSYEFNQV